MQQLTQSVGRLGWALPLFGLQQMTQAWRRSADGTLGGDAIVALDAVTRASVAQCSTSVQQTFATGDRLQRDLVDTVFRLVPTGGCQTTGAETAGAQMPEMPVANGQMQMPGMAGMSEMLNPLQMMGGLLGRQACAMSQGSPASSGASWGGQARSGG